MANKIVLGRVIGEVGPEGPRGPKGNNGERGEKGDTALTVRIGTVTTGSPGSQASVINRGTNTDLVLDFVIPQGQKGDNGETTVYVNNQAQTRVDLDSITNAEIDELFEGVEV